MSKAVKDALIAEIIDACAAPEHPVILPRDPDRLLSPCSIGAVTLSNRCVIAPLDPIGGGLSPDETARRFYLERTGAGLLTSWPIPAALGDDPRPVMPWHQLNEKLHARGAKIFLQIALDGSEPDKAVRLAVTARASFFDGVCLYARENDKDALATVRAIRARFGAAFPILYRASLSPAVYESSLESSGNKHVRSLHENLTLLTALAQEGVDAFEVGLGCMETPWLLRPASQLPPACFAEAARALKAHFMTLKIAVPVLAFGRLDDPAVCEGLLADRLCDMVSLDGAGIGDPDLFRKLQGGRAQDIRPQALPDFAVCPGRETVAVIGAGCRGLQYAIRAADAGHHVELFDAAPRPGGKLALYRSGAAYEKKRLLDYLLSELDKRAQISLRTGTRADAALLKKSAYDRIVFACRPAALTPPGIPGWGEMPFVTIDALSDELLAQWKRKHVAVLGSDSLACDIAWALQSEGLVRKALLITDRPALMPEETEADRAWFLHHFPLRGGEIVTGAHPLRMRRHSLVLALNGKEKHLRCDAVILAAEAPAPLRLYGEAVREKLAPNIQLL